MILFHAPDAETQREISVKRYKHPTPNPLPASDEGAKMYLIRAETAVRVWRCIITG